jgi:radical SAM protein with 4Fe4S-binding SPASM domain
MCPRQEMTRPIFDMASPTYRKIIDDISLKTNFIWLQDYGEPFLNKSIFDMICYAKSKGLRVGISSNATVLTDKIIDGIFDSKLDYLIFAIDGGTKETYEKVRVGGTFEKVVSNVERFLEKKKLGRHKIFTVIQCIYMETTEGDISKFRTFWRRPGVDSVRIRQVTYSGKNGKFDNQTKRKPCYWLWSNPHIKNDGTVVPCCQDVNATLALGNVNEQRLDQIWNNEKMIDLRQKHLDGKAGDIPLCRGCNMYQPSNVLILGSSIFDTFTVNRLIPKIESIISRLRY